MTNNHCLLAVLRNKGHEGLSLVLVFDIVYLGAGKDSLGIEFAWYKKTKLGWPKCCGLRLYI